MKILVTGCAGFIGANFTRFLLENYPDDYVVGVDALTYAASDEALEELCELGADRFAFYHADITSERAIEEIFRCECPDVVVNFAAESHVDRSIADASLFVATNVDGVRVLLDASVRHGVHRFHQVSTDEVYGDLSLDSTEKFTEDSPLLPSSPYSASKAAADLLTLAYARTHGLSVSISRSSNNYGKHQHKEKFVPTVISAALSDERVPIYGDGKNERDWLYVIDNCRAIDMIVRRGRAGEIYNVGTGISVDNLSLAKRIISHLGKTDDLITYVSNRKGHDAKYVLDCAKIQKELGWQPKTELYEGLLKTVDWYAERIDK
jgi:dTDP-glucose 4,6-dehydratase